MTRASLCSSIIDSNDDYGHYDYDGGDNDAVRDNANNDDTK